ncbi:MAG: thiamine pyrophosphate-dependent enzyme [Planctomycetota bacterium]
MNTQAEFTQATTTRPTNQPTQRLSDALPDDVLIGWLSDMVKIREFETRTMAAYQQAKIGGFCHVYIGQEAVVVGTRACVEASDPCVTAYRDHGHALAWGMHPNTCMAEMYGKQAGCAKGKGGSMHMFDKPNNLFGGHGIVGAQNPLGLGLAFAARYENEVIGKAINARGDAPAKRVALCFLGDGALNQGALHEAMNISNLPGQLRSPVIFIVENNRYSMGTAIQRGTTMAHDLGAKARAYGMSEIEIDGYDVRNIYDLFKPFVDECREEQKPGFVNLHCYRYQGHSMSDPQKYRTKAEVEESKGDDCIDNLANYLMNDRGCLTEDYFKSIQKEMKQIAKDAITFAESAPAPDPALELASDVYVDPGNTRSNVEYVEGEKNELL